VNESDRVFDFDVKPKRGKAKPQAQLAASDPSHPYVIGQHYLIRTVTMIDTGKVIRVTQQEIVLVDAAWIADTGRFSDALKSLEFSEVEPFPDGEVIIGRGAIVDAVKIKAFQRRQK
jgi:hypothetical protein